MLVNCFIKYFLYKLCHFSGTLADDLNCITPEKTVLIVENDQFLNSPIGIWSIEKTTGLLSSTNSNVEEIKVKKALFCDKIINNAGFNLYFLFILITLLGCMSFYFNIK